jgi:hypothetical protein
MSTEPTPQERVDAEALLDLIGDDEPCGENSCHCHCTGGHVCGCDCWRCDQCQQTADHCQCDEED